MNVKFTSATLPAATLTVTASACGYSTASSKAIVVNLGCRISDDDELVNGSGIELNAYPNPTSGKLSVTFNASENEKYVLRIVDVLGQVLVNESRVATGGSNLREIDLSGAAKGMYFLSIEKEGAEIQLIRIMVE